MTLVVTAGTGPFGHAAVETLITRGVDPGDIVTGGRRLGNAADLADRGVRVLPIDYDQPGTVKAAFEGAERVLFVSGDEMGQRVTQSRTVVEAAVAAGVRSIAYTSAPYAATTKMLLASEHAATEEIIRGSGLPFTFLRNGWYFENYLARIPALRAEGAIVSAAGDGRISAAARADYAEAGAVVLTTDGHAGRVYELGGDQSFSLPELAARIGVEYREAPVAQLVETLVGTGLPPEVAEVYADVDRAVADGELFIDSGDLARLLGRAPTTLDQALLTG